MNDIKRKVEEFLKPFVEYLGFKRSNIYDVVEFITIKNDIPFNEFINKQELDDRKLKILLSGIQEKIKANKNEIAKDPKKLKLRDEIFYIYDKDEFNFVLHINSEEMSYIFNNIDKLSHIERHPYPTSIKNKNDIYQLIELYEPEMENQEPLEFNIKNQFTAKIIKKIPLIVVMKFIYIFTYDISKDFKEFLDNYVKEFPMWLDDLNLIKFQDIFQNLEFLYLNNVPKNYQQKAIMDEIFSSISLHYTCKTDNLLSIKCSFAEKRSLDYTSNEKLRKELSRPQEMSLDINYKYNSDLITLYQRAVESYFLNLKFLMYYQILESFFLEESNKALYHRLNLILKDNHFALTPKNFQNLVSTINQHKSHMNETQMLELVIKTYIGAKDLQIFLKKYEECVDKKPFSKSINYFGEKFKIPINDKKTIIRDTAKMIKETRNALVHSSDKYENRIRYLPDNIQHQKLVDKQIPLMRFLAEKVIFGSSKEL